MLETTTLKSFKEPHTQGVRFYLGSIFFHLVLIILFLFLPQSMKSFIFGNHEQRVIREFVQVDLVGMPKLTKKELKELAPIVDISKDPVANSKRQFSRGPEFQIFSILVNLLAFRGSF